ncbi:vacuolar protein sorting-associated protein 18-like, partial [Tropilaelaps mercedesae]
MTSLLEQYEAQVSEPGPRNQYPIANPTLPQNSVVRLMQSEPDTPMFKKMKIEFNPKESLTHLVVCNEILVIGMVDKSLLKVSLKNPDEPEPISLASQLTGALSHYRMHRVFLDPLGNHLVVSVSDSSVTQGENFYIYLGGSNGNKRIIQKILRNHLITAAAFNPDNQQNTTTGPILLATSSGLVFETELSAPTDNDWRFSSKSTSSEKYCKQ